MAVRRLLATLGMLALPPVGLTIAFNRIVRRNLYYTDPYQPGVPEATGVPFEPVRFWTADGSELGGWLFQGGDLPVTVLFMHGTSYNASLYWDTEERAQLFGSFLRELGCRFFLFDYRGYGANGGEATELNTYLDADAALAYLHNRKDIDAARIVLYGFSLGSGVAVDLAWREPNAGLMLRAPFTSVRDLVLERYPRMRPLLTLMPWLPTTRYNSAVKIRELRVPLLLMHGDADETVPYWMGRRLYELAPEPKTFVPFPGGGHQEVPLEIMAPAMRGFLEKISATQVPR